MSNDTGFLPASSGWAMPAELSDSAGPPLAAYVQGRVLTLPAEMPFVEWDAIGDRLARAQERIETAGALVRLWRADWWRFGVEHYGQDIAMHARSAWGISARTVANDVSATRNLTSEARTVTGATFNQMAAVAAVCPPERQAEVLREAAENGWNRDEIDEHVNGEAAAERIRAGRLAEFKRAYLDLDDKGRRAAHSWMAAREFELSSREKERARVTGW